MTLRQVRRGYKSEVGHSRTPKEAPRRLQSGMVFIDGRTSVVIPCAAHKPPHQKERKHKAVVNASSWLLHQ